MDAINYVVLLNFDMLLYPMGIKDIIKDTIPHSDGGFHHLLLQNKPQF